MSLIVAGAEASHAIVVLQVYISLNSVFILLTTLLITSLLVFRHLDRTNHRLAESVHRFTRHHRSNGELVRSLSRFAVNHTRLVVEVIKIDRFVGHFYLLYTVSIVPASAFFQIGRASCRESG